MKSLYCESLLIILYITWVKDFLLCPQWKDRLSKPVIKVIYKLWVAAADPFNPQVRGILCMQLTLKKINHQYSTSDWYFLVTGAWKVGCPIYIIIERSIYKPTKLLRDVNRYSCNCTSPVRNTLFATLFETQEKYGIAGDKKAMCEKKFGFSKCDFVYTIKFTRLNL